MTINAITAFASFLTDGNISKFLGYFNVSSDKALLIISKDNKTCVYSLPSNDPGIDSLIKTKLIEKGV